MSRSTKRLIVLVLCVPLLVVSLGLTYGFGMKHLEHEPRTFLESLEWAAETLTTTGYGQDSRWTHPVMNVFVMVVQFVGVFFVFLVFPIYLIPFLEERFEARLPRQVRKMSDHVIIYRYGPAVVSLLQDLRHHAVPTLVIEPREAEARHLIEEGETVLCLQLDDEALDAAHLGSARALIANGSDEENAGFILGARQAGFEGDILALVEEPEYLRPMMLAGASGVFTPRHVLAAALADRVSDKVSPRLMGGQLLGKSLEVVEIRVTPDSELAGKTLEEAQIDARTGVTIIGQWVHGRLIPQPPANIRIEPRGILVAVGNLESVHRFAGLAGYRERPKSEGRIVILGHGEVGRKVAQLLREVGDEVCVVERSAGPEVDIVGDALDADVLERAGVRDARGIVLALDSDSAILFATVIVRDLGGELPIVARVNQPENVERIHQAGADFALSISQVAGQILAHRLLGEEIVSIAPQLRVMRIPGRTLAGKRASELDIRERTGCSVVAVEREDEIIDQFGGHFVIEEQDTIYVCGSDRAARRFSEEFEGSGTVG